MTPIFGAGELHLLKFGFIGAGRLGCALAVGLEGGGLSVVGAASRREESARRLVAGTRAAVVMSAQEVADRCDVVFVTTPDAAIERCVSALQWRAGTGVVHCSGATEIAALAKAARDGASIGGFHPMQTFGEPLVAARSLAGCVVTIEAEGALRHVLVQVAAALGFSVNELPAGARGRYHAAAGFASQYVNVLLGEAVRIWQSWGADEATALRALLPLVRGTLSSIESTGVARGMPGPVSRGDAATVARHVKALGDFDESTLALYRLLCLRSVTLAEAAGAIDAAAIAEIRAVLESGPRV